MKQIIRWLKTWFSRTESTIAADQPSDVLNVEPVDIPNDDNSIESSFNEEGPDRIDTSGHGKEVSMPDIYADEHVATEPDLKDFDLRSPGVVEPDGFNPYDTGVLQKK